MVEVTTMQAIAQECVRLLANAAVRGSLLLLMALPVAWLLRRRSAALRSHMWHTVIAALLALPVLCAALPEWRVELPAGLKAPAQAAGVQVRSAIAALDQASAQPNVLEMGRAVEVPVPDVSAPTRTLNLAWPVWLFLLWAAGAAAVAARLLLSYLALRRLERSAHPLTDGRVHALVAEFARATGTTRTVDLLAGPTTLGPITWGVFRPRVLLPSRWECWPEDVLRAVLAHELAHTHRHDLASQLLCDVARGVFWFNPLVWLAAREAHIAREQACDDEVIARGVAPVAYADALLELARALRQSAASPRVALAMAREHELKRRIRAVIDADRARERVTPAVAVAAGLIIACGTAALATVSMPAAATAVALLPSLDAPDDARPVVAGAIGSALDSAFTALEREGFSGSVLIAWRGDVVYSQGIGLADRARTVPATPATRYHVAGITKAFTAAAVADLIERGVVAADAPIGRYLPELRGEPAAITVHQLLTHTDGLADVHVGRSLPDAQHFLQAINETGAVFRAGSAYGPGNAGHSLLAVLVERIGGAPFDAQLRTRFLAPAGMQHSFLRTEAGVPLDSVAIGYLGNRTDDAVMPAADEWGTRGSRGLVTTAPDLYRWYRAFQDDRLISRAARELMLSSYVETAKSFGQGYGWLLHDESSAAPIRTQGPLAMWRRSGREPGFEAELVHDRNADWVAVLLINSDTLLRMRAIEEIRAVMARATSAPLSP